MRLWRRAHLYLREAEFIFGDGKREVCDGAHSLFVMKDLGHSRTRCMLPECPPFAKNAKDGPSRIV
jgi:hypothetical protein